MSLSNPRPTPNSKITELPLPYPWWRHIRENARRTWKNSELCLCIWALELGKIPRSRVGNMEKYVENMREICGKYEGICGENVFQYMYKSYTVKESKHWNLVSKISKVSRRKKILRNREVLRIHSEIRFFTNEIKIIIFDFLNVYQSLMQLNVMEERREHKFRGPVL